MSCESTALMKLKIHTDFIHYIVTSFHTLTPAKNGNEMLRKQSRLAMLF